MQCLLRGGLAAFASSALQRVSWPLAVATGVTDDTEYTVGVLAVIILGLAIVIAVVWWLRDDDPMGFEEALAPGKPPRILWAGDWRSEEWLLLHLAISGTTRSGKSILFSLYLRSIIPPILPKSDRRLILYDPKNALHPALFADVPVPVRYLLPTDERSSPWDLARDFDNPAAVVQFCEALFPQPQHDNNPFFTLAEREIVGAVLNSLNWTHWHSWDLADVVHILEEREFIVQVLGRCAATRPALRLMGEPRTWANIEATLATHLNPLRIMAAMWSRADGNKSFSLSDFVKSEGILVLGRDPRYGALLDPINTLLLTHLFSHLLAQGDSRTRRTYVAIDELAAAGGENRPLPGLKDVAERGASRGVVLAITYHSYASIKKIYQDDADAILAMLQNRVFLTAGDGPTADFNSKLFGKSRKWIKVHSNTSSPHGGSRTVSDHYHEEDVVPFEEFLKLPPASPKHGLTGYWLSPAPLRSSSPFHLSGAWIDRNLPRQHPDIEPYVMRPDFHQHLAPLGYKELRRLKLTLPEAPEEDDDPGAAVAKAPRLAAPRPSAPPLALAPPREAQDDMTGKLRRLIGGAWSPHDAHEA